MADAVHELDRGRALCSRRAWAEAHSALAGADRLAPLGADDLELMALAAYMLNRDDDYVLALERAHRAHLDAGEPARAARSAFWIGLNLFPRGEAGPAMGWFGRGRRLIEPLDCVERGYLLIPELLRHVGAGDADAAHAVASQAAEIAARFGDPDLFSLAVHEQGHALVRQGRVQEGLRLIDETMVAVTAGELSPVVTGIIYCNTISFCQSVFELRRARDWTAALTLWWDQQPEMVAFTGRCLVHRAEVMQLRGAWADALEEARRAGERLAAGGNARATGYAHYRQGELLRLRGETAAAEEAFRAASRFGWEPQPGLALLRLAQGNGAAAAAAVRRALVETGQRLARAALLPACVEVMLFVGATPEAAAACRELEEIALGQGSDVLGAMSAQARGAVALAEGDAAGALPALRGAWRAWQELEAPYEAARARVLVGLACRALGDADAAGLELDAARADFAELGAVADVSRVDALAGPPPPADPHGLTARELQVLRLVATGRSNRQIAAELVLSERTVDRHVSNIFTKVRVSTRAAATAYAYEHGLISAEGPG